MLKVCITFDYELYMGKNNCDLKEVLIRPTEKLLNMLNRNNVKATFFADVCCPMFFQQVNKEKEFVISMEKQMQDMEMKSHDVQLHIHPHWLQSDYDEKTKNIVFDKKYYRIHSFGFDDGCNSVDSIIKNGVQYLENLLEPVNKNYKCIAYRAGGFAIQPERQLTRCLLDNGIKIDSSIAEKCQYLGTNMRYDFVRCYTKKHNFYFNDKYGFNKMHTNDDDNALFEVPIGACSIPIVKNIIKKLNSAKLTNVNRGTYMSLAGEKIEEANNRISRRIHSLFKNPIVCSLDSLDYKTIYQYLKFYIKMNMCSINNTYICIIGHPKGFSESHINNLENLINKIRNNNKMDFVTMRDIYNEIS